MSKTMEAILAQRFSPFNFLAVPGFPHPVPTMIEWGDFLPIFRERKEDNPADHLIKFHGCMNLLDLQHEDFHMNMFMYSLDGDAREWYFSLPPSIISSLKDFHTVFHEHYKRYFSHELLLEDCCEKYRSAYCLSNQIQETVFNTYEEQRKDEFEIEKDQQLLNPMDVSFSPCIQNQKFIRKIFQNTSIDIKACDSHVQKESHPIEDISQKKK